MHKYTLRVLLGVLVAAVIILVFAFTRDLPFDMTNPATVFCIDQGGNLTMVSVYV